MANILDKTRKMLWGRSAGICSICKKQLFEDESLTDDPSVLGQECHIVGEKDNNKSPRGQHSLPVSQRDTFDNLILLCRDHHKIIDDKPQEYPVEELHRIKNEHLLWVKATLGLDEEKQRDEETYAGFVDTWSRLSNLEGWEGFTYGILSGDAPAIRKQRWADFEELQDWLFNRIYPERYPSLNQSFENFRCVLHDFRKVFSKHTDPNSFSRHYIETLKFYKIDHWNEELYKKLGKEYDEHVNLLSDYALELTRAANYVCDNIRKHVIRSFRLKEGVLIARTGTWGDGSERSLRVSYRHEEKTDRPYPGLNAFLAVRLQRDFSYGSEG